MTVYDWIVVGGGITGAALSYELTRAGFSVLLLERHSQLQGATRYGYGGLAYWAGTTELTRQICVEGKALHTQLTAELEASTEYRELDLILTITPDANLEAIEQFYTRFADPPQLLTVEAACELEPLLNPGAIAGAVTVKHGHIHPGKTARAYLEAMQRHGSTWQVEEVIQLLRTGDRISGVQGRQTSYASNNIVICAGALSRKLLKQAGIPVRTYFTHAELIETPRVDLRLRTLVMPAETQRFHLEISSSQATLDPHWDTPGQELAPAILDAGAIQFLDGSLRLGQVSRALSDPDAPIDRADSEARIRAEVGRVLPALADIPGTWHHCLVAFSADQLPLIGTLPDHPGLYLFTGFSNPLAIVPPLARRFAGWARGQADPLLEQLSPTRFQPETQA